MEDPKKRFIKILLLICAVVFLIAAFPSSITVTIQGLPCPYCVNNLKNNLNKVQGISSAEISSDNKMVRITPASDKQPDVAEIKQAIINSGFIPLSISTSAQKINHMTVKNKPCTECHKK